MLLALANEGTACCDALRSDWHEATFHHGASIRLLSEV
jgi:hypothetical protein